MGVVARLERGLVVSCQATEDTPFHGPVFMAAMARAAEMGGAVGIRANGPADIAAIKNSVHLPIIGIWKVVYEGYEPYITPTLEDARQIAEAGADIIALDATLRPHPRDLSAQQLIAEVKTLGLPVMADISTFEEGIAAAEAGADIVATTMSGYTRYSPQSHQPDFKLIEELARALSIPVIAEGKIGTPDQARRAIDLGAFAVVVGAAITQPWTITEKFSSALR
ncbi:MAG: N-acetylmannosamine-6-phosphate 2-epimerase [Armatimonadetes bacterium]|nr:N-acetylmannosamine-6-phosphate 2-epimerase [Armatimonadota bacterium]